MFAWREIPHDLEGIYARAARERYEAWLAQASDGDPDPAEVFKAGFLAGAEIVMHDEVHTGNTPGCHYCKGSS